MTIMKKLLTVLCATICILTMAGCGNSDANSASSTTAQSSNTTTVQTSTAAIDESQPDNMESASTTTTSSMTSTTTTAASSEPEIIETTESDEVKKDPLSYAFSLPEDLSVSTITRTDRSVTVIIKEYDKDFSTMAHYIWNNPDDGPTECVIGLFPLKSNKTIDNLVVEAESPCEIIDFVEKDGNFFATINVNELDLPQDDSLIGIYEINKLVVDLMNDFAASRNETSDETIDVSDETTDDAETSETIEKIPMTTEFDGYTLKEIKMAYDSNGERCVMARFEFPIDDDTPMDKVKYPSCEAKMTDDTIKTSVQRGMKGRVGNTAMVQFNIYFSKDFEALILTVNGVPSTFTYEYITS